MLLLLDNNILALLVLSNNCKTISNLNTIIIIIIITTYSVPYSIAHSETYTCYFGLSPLQRNKLGGLNLQDLPLEGLTLLSCGGLGVDIDTIWNELYTPTAARIATGCVIEAAISVAKGQHKNAFAVVRPPGKIIITTSI